MTPPAPPGDPARGSLGRAAVELLSRRNVLDAESPDFAKNCRFRRLHGGELDGPEKPVVLFTACPHDLAAPAGALTVPPGVARWASSPPPVAVDGESIPILGTECKAARPLLAVEKGGPWPYRSDVLLYRELHPSGFYEWGASGLFFGRNGRIMTGLRLCHMMGEYRVFLESLAPLYARMGLDGPFIAFLSIRNSRMLVLDTYGDELHDRPWDDKTRRPPIRLDPATSCANIQWRRTFGSAGESAGGGVAQAAADAAARVCSEYNEDDPGCCSGGAFPWGLWRRAREGALKRYRPAGAGAARQVPPRRSRPGGAGGGDAACRVVGTPRAETGGETGP